MKKKNELTTYYVKLAKLDAERKAILTEMKSRPAYAIAFIKEAFDQKVEKWLVRDNGTGKPMAVTEADKVIRFLKDGIVINQSDVNAGSRQTRAIRKINTTMYHVKMSVENLAGATYTIDQYVSVDRPMVPQLFQSMHELSPVMLKKVQKDIEKLENQRKKADEIKKLEDVIAKATAELKKLKTTK